MLQAEVVCIACIGEEILQDQAALKKIDIRVCINYTHDSLLKCPSAYPMTIVPPLRVNSCSCPVLATL